MKTKHLLTFLAFLCAAAQIQAAPPVQTPDQWGVHWYFGVNAGIDFTSGAAVPVTHGALSTFDNTAVMSDPVTGQLLFYSDGVTVWNHAHQVMQNGTGLMGNQTGGQPALAVRKPGSASLYYLFTVDAFAWPNGLRYSIIDMSQNGGLGAVTSVKNVQLLSSATEKLIAIPHAEDKFVWILAHGWNNNSYHAWLLGPAGLSATPVTTQIGTVHTGGSTTNYNAMGQMNVSLAGDKIVSAIYDMNRYEVFDFNRSTGVLSNPRILADNSRFWRAWGAEFSPDGNLLYVTQWSGGHDQVWQMNLNAGNASAIVASATQIGTVTNPDPTYKTGYLQLAPDGRIYVAKWDSPYLSVIQSPNQPGIACGFVDNGFYLAGRLSRAGLPQYLKTAGMLLATPEAAPVQEALQVYPNPVTHQVHIRFQTLQEHTEIRLFSLDGVCVRSLSLHHTDLAVIHCEDLPAGTYMYECRSTSGIRTGKVVVVRN